jgi:hypothetical protein
MSEIEEGWRKFTGSIYNTPKSDKEVKCPHCNTVCKIPLPAWEGEVSCCKCGEVIN